MGKILGHKEVESHHNQLEDPEYEWGLEGPQLISLPNGKILLSAVCFLPGQPRGKRQRVFFAVSGDVAGPYKTLGPILDSVDDDWQNGENGHAAGIVQENKLLLFYQGRSDTTPWRYGLATIEMQTLLNLSEGL
jgi:hypothetical protein